MQMHHSGVEIFIISRLNTKAPNIKQQLSQIDHSHSTIKTCGACIGPIAFDVMMLYLSQDDKLSSCGLWMFQISTMVNSETSLWTLEAFLLVQTIMTKRSAIALWLSSWSKLTILQWVSWFFSNFNSHDKLKAPNLMVFREISFWNEMSLCSIKTEMFTFAES